LLAPVHERFERFDRWSRRAVAADPAFGSRASLEETLFAPLRREDDVCGAWIERAGTRPALAYGPLDAPPGEALWVRVRDEALGEVEVTAVKIRPEGSADDAAGDRCVLVRRVRPGSDGVDVSVALGVRASE
jgi:hypothetical protein